MIASVEGDKPSGIQSRKHVQIRIIHMAPSIWIWKEKKHNITYKLYDVNEYSNIPFVSSFSPYFYRLTFYKLAYFIHSFSAFLIY